MHGSRTAATRYAPNQQQDNWDKYCGKNSPRVEHIDIGHERGLAANQLADVAIRVRLRFRRRRPLLGEVLGHLFHGGLKHRRRGVCVFNKP